jgi:serine acetyltransferase
MKRKRKVIFLRDHSDKKKARVDIDPQNTSYSGILGLYELALRRFKTLVYALTVLPLYILASIFVGVAFMPGIALFQWASDVSSHQNWFVHAFAIGLALGTGFFLYGFTLLFVLPLANFILRARPKVHRGPYYSIDFLQWYVHNALTYLMRYTFLEFITPTPFNILFYQLMGMKIGKGTQINTSFISDPALIELGKRVTIGGSATLCAHYGQGGYLVVAPVSIGDNVTIGLKASIMGGVEIGNDAKVMPHSVILPKTKIGAGETWGGVPAQKLSIRKAA